MDFAAKVGVIGSGYWGKNLVRNFKEIGALNWVCDTDPAALAEMAEKYQVNVTRNLDDILADANTPGVVIATPAADHFATARRCLLAGKDVYVEKPLALRASEGQELVELANSLSRMLMVGHILEYHPAILKLRHLIREGELGRIQYIYSSRLNLGKLRTVEDILWSFAPHDISAILFLLNEKPHRVAANGGTYLKTSSYDTTLTTCDFPSGVKAHIFVSWLHPFKEQKLTIVGDRKMAVFDDTSVDKKLVLYSHRIEWHDRMPVAFKEEGHTVELPRLEPLRQECEHFLESMVTRRKPRTSGESGVQVLRVLEACEESLKDSGRSIQVPPSSPKYFAHPTAVIDDGAEIGEGTKIWHFSHIMSKSRMGRNCNLGQNVVISPDVVIGNNVKIQNNVSVYTGCILEDDVFCGPSMVFTNVVNPRSHIVRRHEYRRTLVKRGASIGANATVVCGVTLGRYCFVGAGAVITHDVPDHALMVGVPAVQKGWVCYCGVRLPINVAGTGEAHCAECGRRYSIQDGKCNEVPAELTVTAA